MNSDYIRKGDHLTGIKNVMAFAQSINQGFHYCKTFLIAVGILVISEQILTCCQFRLFYHKR